MGEASFDEVAAELGLRYEANRVEGRLEGHTVRLERTLHRGNLATCVVAKLEPPLDLGLDVRLRVFGAAYSIRVGNPDLDAEFQIRADSERRLRELLGGKLGENLVSLHRRGLDLTLTDEAFTLSFEGFADFAHTREGLVDALRRAAEVARLVDEARGAVSVPELLSGHRDALSELAGTLGLSLGATPLRLEGQLDQATISATSSRLGPDRHALGLEARHEERLGLGLRISRTRVLDRVATLLGGQDVRVGDDAFDRAFRVRAAEGREARVAALFDPEDRALLVEIAEACPDADLELDDEALRLRAPAPALAPARLRPWLTAFARLSGALRRRARLGSSGGAYR